MSGSPATQPGRILVVEDLEQNRELFRTVLARAGYAVETAADGRAALAALQAGTFDLVLMDVQMPVLDGLAATREIRRLEGPASEVTVVGMSANVLPEHLRAFEAAGMDDHLGKPFRRAQLLEKVAAWLGRSGAAAAPSAGMPPAGDAARPAGDPGRRAAADPDDFPSGARLRAGAEADPDDLAAEGGDPRAAVTADLDELVDLMGRDWLLAGLAKLTERIDETFAAEEPSDARLVARQAHALVSQAALVGFRGFADACSTLEEACLRGDAGAAYRTARTIAAAVRREVERLRAQFRVPSG
ncbi:MAG TPA: response regulator [Microvirga sp.]|nr:response regulator [Microvirga sp.]